MPWTHDGQCRLETKQVVVMKSRCGSCNLDIVGDMVAGRIARGALCSLFGVISSIE
jgi:hypothetical protein